MPELSIEMIMSIGASLNTINGELNKIREITRKSYEEHMDGLGGEP